MVPLPDAFQLGRKSMHSTGHPHEQKAVQHTVLFGYNARLPDAGWQSAVINSQVTKFRHKTKAVPKQGRLRTTIWGTTLISVNVVLALGMLYAVH